MYFNSKQQQAHNNTTIPGLNLDQSKMADNPDQSRISEYAKKDGQDSFMSGVMKYVNESPLEQNFFNLKDNDSSDLDKGYGNW